MDISTELATKKIPFVATRKPTPDHSRTRTSSHANTQHIARDAIVSHHEPNRTGIKMNMSNKNHHHAGRFREGGGSSPFVFAGISITEVASALKERWSRHRTSSRLGSPILRERPLLEMAVFALSLFIAYHLSAIHLR